MQLSCLLVEDDPANRAYTVQLLKVRGVRVLAVASAEAALELLQTQRFDLLIIDWMLPGMDGLSLVRWVRQTDPDAAILVVTGRDGDKDLEQVMAAGASDYLAKPFTPPAFFARLAVSQARVQDLRRRQQAEGQVRTIVQSMPDAVVFWDMTGIVRRVNASFTQLTGLSAEQALGQSLRVLYQQDSQWSEDLQRGAAEIQSAPVERSFVRADGLSFRAECSTGAVKTQGGQMGWVTIFRDISQRIQMTERLRMTDRLAQMGLLSGGIAHEINNPLTFVLINLNVLEQELQELDPSGQDANLTEMRSIVTDSVEGCHRVSEIIKALRSFARGSDHRPEKVQIADLVSNSLLVLHASLRRRADVHTEFEETPTVLAPPGDLAQVIINLIKNAEECVPPGEKGNIYIRVGQEQGQVLLEVRDEGPGIPANVRARMFDAFYSTKSGRNTGLGLATSQSIVTSLGGVIICESELDRGTTFKVLLPPA